MASIVFRERWKYLAFTCIIYLNLSAIVHADLSVIDYKMPVPAKKNTIYLPVNRFNWR